MLEVLDENRIPVIKAVSTTDGTTVLSVSADAPSHSLRVNTGGMGVVKTTEDDPRNENRKVAFMAVSSVDGVTPVAVYVDEVSGTLLITN